MTSGAKVFWTGPTWTEDGREIVFSSKRSGTSALWRIPASGGESQPLEFGSDDSIEPCISPRGHRLAYMRFPLDVNIYRAVLPDAKHPENTTAPFLASTRQDADGQVSPNSKRIAFDSDRSGNTREIWVCDLDGANCVQVTSLGTWARIPRWSPDGKQIVFEASSGGKTSIYTVDPESRAVRGVVPNPWEERAPSWSSDGRWIYFASKRSGAWQIWRSPAEGGASLQITKHGGFRPFQSPDSRFVYYETGTEVPGVWRVPSEGGEESSVLDQPNIQMADNWALVDDGIYFIQFDLHGQKPGAILFYDFATKQVRTTVKLGTNHILNEGLTVSPDKRSFFYNVWEHSAGDIMLVENFH